MHTGTDIHTSLLLFHSLAHTLTPLPAHPSLSLITHKHTYTARTRTHTHADTHANTRTHTHTHTPSYANFVNGICLDLPGTFNITCNPGYDLIKNPETMLKECADIDECATDICLKILDNQDLTEVLEEIKRHCSKCG